VTKPAPNSFKWSQHERAKYRFTTRLSGHHDHNNGYDGHVNDNDYNDHGIHDLRRLDQSKFKQYAQYGHPTYRPARKDAQV
jgi:hypothetical protein